MLDHLKRKPIAPVAFTAVSVDYAAADIQQIIPHRDPFLLLDTITHIDLTEQSAIGHYVIDAENPIFKGHFPGNPVYPGVLQLESMGQLGLALAHFVIHNTTAIPAITTQVRGLFTKILHAGFQNRLLPGDVMDISAKIIEYDDFLGKIAAQVHCREKLCSYAMLEVYFE
jgi:3-hydroxyacyl-[acyl-carrier-protein] dehydratase